MSDTPAFNDNSSISEATLLGAAINGVKLNVPNFEVIFRDFERLEELHEIHDEERYPLSLYVEMCDFMEQAYGYGAMLKLGRDVGRAVIAVSLSNLEINSLGEAVQALQGAHEHFCTPTIGAFTIEKDMPGDMTIGYTAPYNCKLQEGLLAMVAQKYGADKAIVGHRECQRKGADKCTYRLTYS